MPKDSSQQTALTKLLVFLNCCTDHLTITCGKQPLRFDTKSPQSLSDAENHFAEKHLKNELRVVPGCGCQLAQNHYQKERDLTLNCTQQDRRQKPRSTSHGNKTPFTTDDVSTRHAKPSLSVAHLYVDDNSRL